MNSDEMTAGEEGTPGRDRGAPSSPTIRSYAGWPVSAGLEWTNGSAPFTVQTKTLLLRASSDVLDEPGKGDAIRSSFFRDALLDILGALTDAELDDPEVGHSFLAERILRGNRFDLLAALPDRQDDPAVPRNLTTGHEEVARGVVLVQESHVRLHLRVDLFEGGFVAQFDYEHVVGRGKSSSDQRASPKREGLRAEWYPWTL